MWQLIFEADISYLYKPGLEFTTKVDSMLELTEKLAVAMKIAQLCQTATPGEVTTEVYSMLELAVKRAVAMKAA